MAEKRALLIDIGTGTRDIMLYSDQNSLENNPKIVVPTATRKLAKLIRESKKDLRISGYTMGGGPLASAMIEHLKKGYKIEIEPKAAFTVRNNLEQLTDSGFSICEKIEKPDICFDEIEIETIIETLKNFGVEDYKISLVGLSLQDHGDHKRNESSRRKRFELIMSLLGSNADLRNLIFSRKTVPEFFSRMLSGVKCIGDKLGQIPMVVMDTCISAVAGCLFDPNVQKIKGPTLFINFGNGHTMACVMENLQIYSLYEHHTGIIKDRGPQLGKDLLSLIQGNLSFESVFADGGHGCHTFKKLRQSEISGIVVTGPRREIAKSINLENFYQAAPGGDMMMTGPLGLLKGYNLLEGLN